MKRTSLYICSLALAAASVLVACDNEFERPPMIVPTVSWTANTTVEEFKALYWSSVDATPVTVGLNAAGDSIIVKGRVCSSDASGNIFKYLFIQGETEALPFTLDFYDINQSYKYGQEVYVNLTGLTVGGYGGLMCVGNGQDDRGRVARCAQAIFAPHAAASGLPSAALVDTVAATISEVAAAKSSAEGLQKWQGQLVRFDGITFADAGLPFAEASNTKRYFTDADGNKLMCYNSPYADFKDMALPAGSGSVVGILSYFSPDWQLLLVDAGGFIGFDGILAPVFTPKAGTVLPGTEVTIACPTGGAEVRYTLDGTEPTAQSTLYTAAIVLNYDTVIKAVAVKDGKLSSVVTASYKVSADAPAEGDGSQESPFTPGQVIDMNPTSTSEAVTGGSGVWVSGYIVGYMPTEPTTALSATVFGADGAGNTNLVIAASPDVTDPSQCVGIQLPAASVTAGLRDALNLQANPGNLGKLLAIKGDVMKYCGGPGVKNGSAWTLDGEGSGDEPTPPPSGDAIFSETFLDGTLGSFAVSTETSSTWTGWRANTSTPLCAIANSYVSGTNYEATSWLTSPAIDLSGVTAATLTFEQAYGFYFPTAQEQFCTVNVRETGGEWQQLTLVNFPTKGAGNWTDWVSNDLDISAFAGKTVEIGFKYHNDGGSQSIAWEIRNLTVK